MFLYEKKRKVKIFDKREVMLLSKCIRATGADKVSCECLYFSHN